MTQPRLPAPSPVVRELRSDWTPQNVKALMRVAVAIAVEKERNRFFQVIESMLPATDVSAIKDRLEGSR